MNLLVLRLLASLALLTSVRADSQQQQALLSNSSQGSQADGQESGSETQRDKPMAAAGEAGDSGPRFSLPDPLVFKYGSFVSIGDRMMPAALCLNDGLPCSHAADVTCTRKKSGSAAEEGDGKPPGASSGRSESGQSDPPKKALIVPDSGGTAVNYPPIEWSCTIPPEALPFNRKLVLREVNCACDERGSCRDCFIRYSLGPASPLVDWLIVAAVMVSVALLVAILACTVCQVSQCLRGGREAGGWRSSAHRPSHRGPSDRQAREAARQGVW